MMTGQQYKDSLRDGRVVFLEGRRVEDVTDEPAFATSIQWAMEGYDKHHSMAPDATNPALDPPRSGEELRQKIEATHEGGFLLHVTSTSAMAALTAAPVLRTEHPELAERVYAYVERVRREDIRIAECITDAKGNRRLRPAEQDDPDAYVRIVDRTPEGVVIRGAKMHVTGAAFVHDLLVMPTRAMREDEAGYAITCAVPANAPGVKLVNVSYAPQGSDLRHFPVSRHKNVPEALVIFEDVLVPWDRVFLEGQPQFAALFAHSLGLWERGGGIAVAVEQADQLVGLAQLVAEANGLERASHIRDKIAEMAIHATLLRSAWEASIKNAKVTPDGYFYPDELYANAAAYHAAANFSLMVRHLHDIAGGSVVTAPTVADLENAEVGSLISKYMAGATSNGHDRTALFHAIRDLTADKYGGWQHVTNVQAGGGLFAQRLVALKNFDMERAKALVQSLLHA